MCGAHRLMHTLMQFLVFSSTVIHLKLPKAFVGCLHLHAGALPEKPPKSAAALVKCHSHIFSMADG